MKVGYARTSTIEQQAGLEAQKRDLKAAGCSEKIYFEQSSAVKNREQLEKAIEYVREGDTLVVTKLDRLARSVPDLYSIVGRLKDKGASLQILNMGLDTSTETGRLMLTIMAAIAEFEREIMLERQKEGILKARQDGKYKGRKPLPKDVKETVLAYIEGGASKAWVAKKLRLGEATIYRIIKKNKESKQPPPE